MHNIVFEKRTTKYLLMGSYVIKNVYKIVDAVFKIMVEGYWAMILGNTVFNLLSHIAPILTCTVLIKITK